MVQAATEAAEALVDHPGTESAAFEWCIVEIFGHRRHAGRGREEERFGSKMLRIDVPVKGDAAGEWETHFYGGSSIFSYTLTDEQSVMRMNKPYEAPARYSLPAPTEDDDDFTVVDDELPLTEFRPA